MRAACGTILVATAVVSGSLSAATPPAEAADADLMNAVVLFLFVVVLIICLISFLINYIAGHGAYVEGKTRKKGTVYIIVTILLLLLTGFGIADVFLEDEAENEPPAAVVQETQEEPAEDEPAVAVTVPPLIVTSPPLPE